LRRIIKETNARIVHTRTIRADVVGRIGATAGAKVINNIVNLYPDDSLTWHGPLKGKIVLGLARATRAPVARYIANAHALTEPLRRTFHINPERIGVIHDGIPLGPWANAAPANLESWGIGDDHFVVFTAARLHPQKGLEDLLNAATKVIAERPDARFVIAGEGPLRRDLEATISSHGLVEYVRLIGWREDIAELLARSDLFVLPSKFEGLPNSVIEAMAASVPVVATAVAGTPEIIEQGETGWLVPPSDPASLAAAILAAMDSDLEGIGRSARKRAEEHFSVKQMSRAFADLYAELL
jgi:glycosyltransferase involved in cell wall biosynthesis